MPILNYTTKIAVEKTFSEICKILVKAGASAVVSEYNEHGILNAISFRLNTYAGLIYYKLPANMNGVLIKIPVGKNRNKEQAARVAWRIIRDWIAAQMALIDADAAEMAQVFLPYAVTGTGQTVYERFKLGGAGTLGITYQEATV